KGAVLFDDEHQGLAAAYDPAKLYNDPRLYVTIGELAELSLAGLLGRTGVRVRATRGAVPRAAERARAAGGWAARGVAAAGELGRVVIGAHTSVRALTVALVARGHVLVQGVPGLGKTLLAKALACALGGEFKRIQGTADLMPSDIIGVHVFDEAQRAFVFRPGPLFA